MGIVQVFSPSVLQANPMKYAREMLYYPLKFPKFEVVNWKALVLEEMGRKIAWEWFRNLTQVYYKRIQVEICEGNVILSVEVP